MSEEYLKSIIDCVSGIECKHETQQIAKYELIEHIEELRKENQSLKEQLKREINVRDEIHNLLHIRIDKAIKLIEEIQHFPHTNENQHKDMKELKEILKGDIYDK